MKNKIDNTETNREKFFSRLLFQSGKQIGRYNQVYHDGKNNNNAIILDNPNQVILIASLTDHSFSFIYEFFGQKNLITVFFSELIFIPDEAEPMPNDYKDYPEGTNINDI